MALLNLTLLELLAAGIALSGLVTALYLYDRTRRRRVVSALWLWPQQPPPPRATPRGQIREPLSLLLQLLALWCLLLAVADWQWGVAGTPRHHVLILDTSAFMRANAANGATLMDEARARALAYLQSVPARDLVQIIRADGAPAAATAFTDRRERLQKALAATSAGWTAANLEQAFELARDSLRVNATGGADLATSPATGEVVYIGPGRLAHDAAAQILAGAIPHVRWIAVGDEVADHGIATLSALADDAEPGLWEISADLVTDAKSTGLRLDFFFEDQPLGGRDVPVSSSQDSPVLFRIRARQAGWLEARLSPIDAFSGNNQARLYLPVPRREPLWVHADNPGPWRALLESLPRVDLRFTTPDDGGTFSLDGVHIFDSFLPADPPPEGIYVNPPRNEGWWPGTARRDVRVQSWASGHPVTAGLRGKDFQLDRALVFKPGPSGVAATDAGSLILGEERDGKRRVVFGFHPAGKQARGQIAAPLLFANAMRWLAPGIFRSTRVMTRPPGLVETQIDAAGENDVQLTSHGERTPIWSVRDGRVRLFTGEPDEITITTPYGAARMNLTVAESAPVHWDVPDGALRGVPPPMQEGWWEHGRLWPILALAALLSLWADWHWFGRRPRQQARGSVTPTEAKIAESAAPSATREQLDEVLR